MEWGELCDLSDGLERELLIYRWGRRRSKAGGRRDGRDLTVDAADLEGWVALRRRIRGGYFSRCL